MNVIKRKLPLGAVGLVLVLALAAVGVVVGNWTQTLTINGTVETATMDAKWVLASGANCYDDDKEKPGLDVAQTQMSLVGDKLTISVNNAFPSYGATCNFELRNNGKLPLELGSLDLVPGAGLSCDPAVPKPSSIKLTCQELTVDFQDGGLQIGQGQSNTLSIRIDVLKGAQPGPNTKYSFSAEACVEPAGTEQCATK